MATLRVKKKRSGRWNYPVIIEDKKEINIRKTDRVVIICGGSKSGKTEIATKLSTVSKDVYSLDALFIRGEESVSFWRERNNISGKGAIGQDNLINSVSNKILIIDNLDKILSGIKYHIVKELLHNSKSQIIVFVSSIDFVMPEIKTFLLSVPHSIINIGSKVPVNRSKGVLWFFSAALAAMGIPDLLGGIMAWKFFKGR